MGDCGSQVISSRAGARCLGIRKRWGAERSKGLFGGERRVALELFRQRVCATVRCVREHRLGRPG